MYHFLSPSLLHHIMYPVLYFVVHVCHVGVCVQYTDFLRMHVVLYVIVVWCGVRGVWYWVENQEIFTYGRQTH